MIKTFLIKAAAAALAVGMLSFFGCSDSLNENNNMAYLLASKTAEESVKYGSITISTSGSRALDVDSISSAVITITGNGIDTPVTKTVTGVTGGKKENITIEKIPVGKNRIISVQACSDDNGSVAIADAVIRAVKDITTGNNPVTVTWSTSRKGYIYNALYVGGVNVSELTEAEMTAIDNATPDCDATNIDLVSFVADFKTGYANLKDKSAYILSSDDELKRVVVEETDDSTEAAPKFSATAYFTVSGEKDVTASAKWASTKETVATVDKGAVTLVSEGETVVSGSYTYGNTTKTGAKQTIDVSSVGGGMAVYVKANYGEVSGGGYIYGWKDSTKPFGEWPGTAMELTSDSAAYYYIVDASKVAKLIFNNNNGSQTPNLELPATSGHYLAYYNKTISSWDWKEYDGTRVSLPDSGLIATVTPEIIIDPTKPTVTISPASGEVSVDGTITIEYKENYATVTAATVTITGEVSKSYALVDFTDGKLTLNVKTDLGITEEGKSIVVNASATNSEGTGNATPATLTTKKNVVAKDTFTWDNVNCYFVLQDRFYSGDSNNDNCYGRVNTNVPQYATFHGGDIPGLTAKMDYFKKLGVNAIWITAPYEQMHGWTSGAGDAFPHYAFHGYYTLDWTFMDQNMGTVEEFRTFVQKCHENGIRVVMDVVMNHTGYEDWQDMIDYGFGAFKDASLTNPGKYNHACFATNGKYAKGGDGWGTNWDSDNFSKWWSSWCRGFDGKFGFATPGGDDVTKCLDGLPDVVQERSGNATIPTFLQTKWSKEVNNTTEKAYGNKTSHTYADYQNPSVANVDWNGKSGNWRESNKGTVVDYQVIWLSAWVRELGIDGFRCDTQKHVQEKYWKQLQQACQSALEAWRKDATKVDNSGAKNWDENFWMTGECCPRGSDYSGAPYTEGYFDSMINFRDSSTSGHSAGSMIKESEWTDYMFINNNPKDDNNNGNHNNLLTYVSSHDTNICRQGGVKLGTMLQLLPGGVQIYYGDESDRPTYSGASGDMVSRSDMNWSDINGSNKAMVEHWGKVGNFRKYNPAVGAGSGTAYKRTYTGTNAGGENKVAISISSGTVDVSGLFNNGTTVYNWYDGKSATVSSGKVTFNGGSVETPVLVSDRNPADYGVKF